jgi:hypothetical protein
VYNLHRKHIAYTRASGGQGLEQKMTAITIKKHVYDGKFWVARITGRDPKWGIARDFVPHKRDVTKCRSNVYRDIEIDVQVIDGAIYEWYAQESSRRIERGFWAVRNGELTPIDRATVMASLEA